METRHLIRRISADRKKILRRVQARQKSNVKKHQQSKFKKGHHSKEPVYLSSKMTEYLIEQDEAAFFYIRKYKGGRLPKKLQGRWRYHSQAEKVLVSWLEDTDKQQWARYPGCPPRRTNNYILHFFGEDF